MRIQDGGDNLDITSDVVPLFSDEEIRDAQKQDLELSKFMDLLHNHSGKPASMLLVAEPPDVKVLCSLWYKLYVREEIIYHTGKEVDDPWRLVIPRDKRSEILSLLHDNKCAGHPCMSMMKLMVGTRLYWPCMRHDIENWVNCCRSCTMAKRGPRQPQHPLQQELRGALFDHVSFDVIGPLPITENGSS